MLLETFLEYLNNIQRTRKSVERVLLDMLDLKQVEKTCSY